MALNTYDALLARITQWAGGSSDSEFAEAVRDSVTLTEDNLNHGWVDPVTGEAHGGLRVPEMVTRALLAGDRAFEVLPPSFLAMRSVSYIEGDREWPLEEVPDAGAGELAEVYRYTPEPRVRWYHLQGRQIRTIPARTGGYTLRLAYWARVPGIAQPNPCLTVLEAYPNVYLYGCLRHVAVYKQDDPGLARWDRMFASAVRAANRASIER